MTSQTARIRKASMTGKTSWQCIDPGEASRVVITCPPSASYLTTNASDTLSLSALTFRCENAIATSGKSCSRHARLNHLSTGFTACTSRSVVGTCEWRDVLHPPQDVACASLAATSAEHSANEKSGCDVSQAQRPRLTKCVRVVGSTQPDVPDAAEERTTRFPCSGPLSW